MGWIRRLWSRPQVEAGMREEMEFHRAARAADLVARGMAPEEAARTARLEFGNPEVHREDCRKELGYRPWDELCADLRFAIRGMKNNPGFAAATITILALAIGVNAAFFSLYSNYVLKPLPIRGVERHFSVVGFDRNGRSTSGWSTLEVEALRRGAGPEMEGLYASDTFQVPAVAPVQRQTMVTSVSGNYFRLLGGNAILGRTLTEAEEREPLAVLSSSGAARFFPDRADPTGEKLRLRTTVLTVIGVMPPEFTGTVAFVPDVWVGLRTEDALRGRPSTEDDRRDLFGLLASDVSVERVQAVLTATASHFPRPQERVVARVELRPKQSLLSDEEGEINVAAALVFAAFLMVLSIACANLANLHLARAAARTHEIAMRVSLGASRWRIVRQLLTESTFTALLGAAGGCLLAIVTVQMAHDYAISLSGVSGISMLPVSADWRVLLYSVVLGLAAGLAFGLLPAIEVTSPSLTASTKRENSSFAGRVRPRRMRNFLIGGQVAASLVLLIVSGILIRNIQRLESVDPGYDLNRVFNLGLDQPTAATLTLIEQQTGVGAVTAVAQVPLHGRLARLPVTVQGHSTFLSYNYVEHRYFETLALPVEGRSFTVVETSARAKVAVVSQATARKLWPTGSPLGQTFSINPPGAERVTAAGVYQVVGVVPDVVSAWLFEGKDSSLIYLPAAAGQAGIESAMVRIDGNPVKTAAAIREVCAGVTNATGCEPASLRGASAMQRLPFQVAAGVAGALGGLALLLTAIGLYSVASYSVVQRKREIGVLLALGASPSQVIHRILSEAWRCVVLGVAAGLPICLVLSKLAASSVLQIRTFDLGAYLSVPALLIIITTLACGGPARRAARMDPMVSLREE